MGHANPRRHLRRPGCRGRDLLPLRPDQHRDVRIGATRRREWRRRFEAVVGAGLPFLVTERDGVVAGYAYCAPWKTRPAYAGTVEDSVYVSPSAVGQGCGTELMRELLDACRAAGLREVIAVIADTGDPASVELHRRFGFTEAGRLVRVGVKHGRRVDTLLLQRSLA